MTVEKNCGNRSGRLFGRGFHSLSVRIMERGLWSLFFVLLPVTSMPLIVRLVRSDVVAAPSGLVLAVLLVGWVLPRYLRGQLRSAHGAIWLVLFACWAFIMPAVRLLRGDALEYKGATLFRQFLSAGLTLTVGAGFYLATMFFAQSENRLRFALRLINLSGAAILIWTALQAVYWYGTGGYPVWLRSIHNFFSVGTLFRQRFVGFTLEPSWLAHQLNLLYLPWWLAAVLKNATVHRLRFRRLTVEAALLAGGIVVLYLTLSRVGLLAFLIVLAVVGAANLRRRLRVAGRERFKTWLRVALILVSLVPAALLLLWSLSKLDYRMRDLFTLNLAGREDPLFYLAEKLSLASRFVYWEAGWRIFCDAPLTGVGLGCSGFYIPDALSDFALRLVEVRDLLFRSETLLNIKSFWIRILAETGIVGFSLFTVWVMISFATAKRIADGFGVHDSPVQRAVGLTACLTLIAYLVEGFSVDTFALPYLWVSIGLSAGAGVMATATRARVTRKNADETNETQ